MKKTLLFIALFSATGMIAQPTLTFPFSQDFLNETPTFHIGNSVEPGPAGSNQTWDFSSANFPATQSGSFDDPANTSFASSYPNADLVGITEEDGATTYIFYNFESDGVYTAGLEIDGFITLSQPYSDPRRDLSSPMSYQDSYTDNAVFESTALGFTTEGESEYVVEVDGYGTVITPGGTFQNVLRIHGVENTTLTFDIGIGEPIITETVIDSYGWVIDGNPIPVFLTFEQTTDGEPDGGNARYLSGFSLFTEEYNNLSGVSLYPVPAENFVNLDMGSNKTGLAVVRIFDIRGTIVKEFTQGIDQLTRFDVSDLPSGFYSLNVQTEEGMATKHFTK